MTGEIALLNPDPPRPPGPRTRIYRWISYHNPTRRYFTPTSVRLIYLSMYDNRDNRSESAPSPSHSVSESGPSPSPYSSFTYIHRCIGYHNPTNRHFMSTSMRPMYLSMYDNRDITSESVPSPSPRSSLTYIHRCIGYRNPTNNILCQRPRDRCI